jgi:hypothetical protein
MKKGEIASQVFMYLLVLVVVGVVAIIGYSGVGNLIKKQCIADIASFKGDLAGVIYDERDMGETRVYERRMPCSFNHICFYDPDFVASSSRPKLQTAFVEEYAGPNNVFLIKAAQPARADYVEAFNISKISLGQKYKCFNNTGGRLRILLEGNGKRGTKVLLPPY